MSERPYPTPSLKSQGAWLMLARTVGIVFSFILPVVVVRFLTKEDFGLYRQSFVVLMNSVTVLSLGFAMSSFYFLSRDTAKRAAAVLNILVFHFVVGGLACLVLYLFPQIIGNIFQSDEMTRLTPTIGIAVWIWLFSLFLETAAVANKEPRPSTVFIIFAQLSKTIFLGGAVAIFGTVESILYAAVIQGSVQTLILLAYLNSRFPRFWTKFEFGFFCDHFKYAVPFGIAATLWMLQTNIHNYFVGFRFSDADYAIYAVGCAQLPFAAILVDSIGSVLIPRMSELQLAGDRAEMIRLTARAMKKLAFFFFPIYVFLFLTAKTFITALFTHNYLESVPIFLVNISLFPFLVLISDPVIRAYKELARVLLVFRIVIFVLLLAALYYGINNFGMVGIITIAIAAAVIEILISLVIALHKLEVSAADIRQFFGLGKVAIVSVISGAVMYAAYYPVNGIMPAAGTYLVSLFLEVPRGGVIDFVSGSLTLGIAGLVFLPVYLCVSSLTGVIEKEELEKVRSVIRRFGVSRGSAG